MSGVTFPNFWSRLFLGRAFQRQFIVAERSPGLERFLTWAERRLTVDISQIPLTKPIFIVGLPRTGSTLLQDLMCLHPDVGYITNTMNQFPSCFCAAETLRRWLRLDVRGERFLKDSVEIHSTSPNEGFGFWGPWLNMDPSNLAFIDNRLRDLPPDRLDAVRLALRKVLWCFPGKTRFLCKNPALLPHLEILAEMFPDARFINILRDPRACANSMIKLCLVNRSQLAKIDAVGVARQIDAEQRSFDSKSFVPFPRLPRLQELVAQYGGDDIRTTAHLWNDAIDFVEARRSRIPHLLDVRYEDLLAEPRQTLDRVLKFSELSPIAETNTAMQEKIAQVGVVRHKNNYGSFDLVAEICAERMQRYGYLPADSVGQFPLTAGGSETDTGANGNSPPMTA